MTIILFLCLAVYVLGGFIASAIVWYETEDGLITILATLFWPAVLLGMVLGELMWGTCHFIKVAWLSVTDHWQTRKLTQRK